MYVINLVVNYVNGKSINSNNNYHMVTHLLVFDVKTLKWL